MNAHQRKANIDMICAAILFFISVAAYFEADNLPPPRFEPLGPAFFPKMLSVGIGGIAIILFCNAVLKVFYKLKNRSKDKNRLSRDDPFSENDDEKVYWDKRPIIAFWGIGLTGIYILILAVGILDYRIATAVYILITGSIFAKFKFKRVLLLVLISVILTLGIYLAFTKLVLLDLP